MIPPIPSELIDEILSHCTDDSLSRCALTNTTLLYISQSHLYHHIQQWEVSSRRDTSFNSVAAHPYLLSHTRHLDLLFLPEEATGSWNALSQVVNAVQGFGKLERLTLQPVSGSRSSLRFNPVLLCLLPMPSLICISITLDDNMVSACCLPFISSPKLRELSVYLGPSHRYTGSDHTSKFVILNPSLNFFLHSPHHLSKIQRLLVGFEWGEGVEVYTVKLLTACNNLTHLTLAFVGLSFDDEEIPTLFIPMQRLRSLTSLTIETNINALGLDKQLDQFHLIFQQLPPKAPMRCIILELGWCSSSRPNMIIENHPALKTLRSILNSRHDPRCQLEIKVNV